MSNAERVPSLSDVLRERMRVQLDDVQTCIPGRVESYDATTQKANIQPLIKKAFTDEEGERQVERLPVIPGVPVQFPSGGGFRITFPIAVGDTGLILFSQASLDVWLSEGGEVDPLDDRRFNLSDGVFLPGVRSFKTPITDASGDHMTLGAEGGLQIHIDGATINIGSNVGAQLEAAALGETIAGYLNQLAIWTGLLSTWATGLGFPDLPPVPPPSFVSLSVKVKK